MVVPGVLICCLVIFALCCVCVRVLIVKAYLTGAPLLWAGLSSTVTVLSVWFKEVSWSYAGMEGAEEKTKQRGVFFFFDTANVKQFSFGHDQVILCNESFSLAVNR